MINIANNIECKFCRNFWQSYPKKRPYPLSDNMCQQLALYKCNACGAYWEESLRFAKIVSEDEAKINFKDYFHREKNE